MRQTNGKPLSMAVLLTDDGKFATTEHENEKVSATTFASVCDGSLGAVSQEWNKHVY